jgi:hypothetical protein
MPRIWLEPYRDQSIPIEYWGTRAVKANTAGLIPDNVLMVSVASFTFHFVSVQQIRDCLAYYERKTHESSRISIPGDLDHWETQRWFDRLPMYLLEEPKRAKVVKALNRALALAESGAFSKPL